MHASAGSFRQAPTLRLRRDFPDSCRLLPHLPTAAAAQRSTRTSRGPSAIRSVLLAGGRTSRGAAPRALRITGTSFRQTTATDTCTCTARAAAASTSGEQGTEVLSAADAPARLALRGGWCDRLPASLPASPPACGSSRPPPPTSSPLLPSPRSDSGTTGAAETARGATLTTGARAGARQATSGGTATIAARACRIHTSSPAMSTGQRTCASRCPTARREHLLGGYLLGLVRAGAGATAPQACGRSASVCQRCGMQSACPHLPLHPLRSGPEPVDTSPNFVSFNEWQTASVACPAGLVIIDLIDPVYGQRSGSCKSPNSRRCCFGCGDLFKQPDWRGRLQASCS